MLAVQTANAPLPHWSGFVALACGSALAVMIPILVYQDARRRGYSRPMAFIIGLFPPSLWLWCLFRPDETERTKRR